MSETERLGGSRKGDRREGVSQDVRDLQRTLESIGFNPRPSLEAEIYGRLRRSGAGGGGDGRGRPRWLLGWVGLALVAAMVVVWSIHGGAREPSAEAAAGLQAVTLDRCCRDFDGGGPADDGILIVAWRDERVLGLSIYEDRDGSGDFSAGDVTRFARGSRPSLEGPLPRGVATLDRCCLDYDLGGHRDDGIFLVSVPPDGIVLAAVYEDRDGSGTISATDLVRYVLR